MYESHYQFQRRPFSATPDSNCISVTRLPAEILAEFVVCTERGQGIGVLTGAAGIGKTLFCERLAEELSGNFKVAFLKNANFATRRSLLQSLLYELGQKYDRMAEQELRLELAKYCDSILHKSAGIVLIIDEAHLLSERLLEEVRTVTNLSTGGIPLVRVILSGQPNLEETLAQPSMTGLNGRIACQEHLEQLTRLESLRYIEYRVNWGGANPQQLFSDEAMDAIAHAADGVPRCLNQLCDHALLLAYVADAEQIDVDLVDQALEDLKQLPQHWNERTRAVGPLDALSRKSPEKQETNTLETNDEEYQFDAFEIDGIESIEIGGPAPQRNAEPVVVETLEDLNDYELADLEDIGHDEMSDEIISDVLPVQHSLTADQPITARAGGSVIAGVVPLASDQQSGPVTFEEEMVVDRYASLDANRREVPPLAIQQQRSPEPEPQPTVANTVEPVPMIREEVPVAKSEVVFDPEAQIGAEILDICRSTHESIVEQINKLNFGEEFETAESSTDKFDVVKPEPTTAQKSLRHDSQQAVLGGGSSEEAEQGVVPRPNNRQLFSKLRRVHHERTEHHSR